METSERLAAYAAGELGPEDAAALEAELAGDASLRARLAAIRRVDEALGSLPEVTPSAAFSASLRDTLRAELAEHAPVHDLAARRARRMRWAAPAAGIAAAVAAVVGIASIGGLTGSDDGPETTALSDMGAEAEESMTLDAAEAPAAAPPGPVYAEGGSYDRDTLTLLASDGAILAARDVAGADPAANQFSFLDQLTAAAFTGDTDSGRVGIAAEAAPDAAGQAATADGADAADLAPVNPVAACVPVILDEGRVPLFADLGTFERREALVVVLGAPAPDGSFSRLEFWVLDPLSCDVLHFAQR